MTFVDSRALSATTDFTRVLSSNLSLLKLSDRIDIQFELRSLRVDEIHPSFLSDSSISFLFLSSISGIIPFHGFSMYGK